MRLSPLAPVLAGCLLLSSPALAQTAATAKAPASCLTQAEFTGIVTYALPSVLEGASRRCAQALPATAYLPSKGAALATRYTAQKNASWPEARKALFKISGSRGDATVNMLRQLPDESLKPIADVMVEGLVAQEIPLEDCTTVNRFAELLAPLPAENTAGLITLLAAMGAKGDKKGPAGVTICKA